VGGSVVNTLMKVLNYQEAGNSLTSSVALFL
jgi:hypothetical protein